MARNVDVRQTLARRDAQIRSDRLAGATYDQIAATHHISPTRARQIVQAHPGLEEEAAARRDHAKAETHRRIEEWSRAHPGAALAQAEAELGVDLTTITTHLGNRIRLHQPAQRPSARHYSDQDIRTALRTFTDQNPTGTSQDYRRLARQHGWPSETTIRVRHGSWAAALRAAGINGVTHPRRSTWSDEQLLDWVDHYLHDSPPPWGPTSMTTWLQQRPEAPSGTLIRQRWGRWQQILDRINQAT